MEIEAKAQMGFLNDYYRLGWLHWGNLCLSNDGGICETTCAHAYNIRKWRPSQRTHHDLFEIQDGPQKR